MKETFHISKTHLKRVIEATIEAIESVLYNTYVSNVEATIPEEDDEFRRPCVMDETFQPNWTPLGTYNE